MVWLQIVAQVLQLFNALMEQAKAQRLKDEGGAAALLRVTTDATTTIKDANAARAAAVARDSTDSGLQQSDGFRRD